MTVVEDIPEMFNGAAMIALIGFGTVSFGSLLMLLALAWDGARARHLSVVRPDQSGASP